MRKRSSKRCPADVDVNPEIALNGDHLARSSSFLPTFVHSAPQTAASQLASSLKMVLVHSPLYGARPAREFYPALFADTSQAILTLKSVMRGEDQTGQMTVSFWFHFDWRLPSGAAAPFDVVDIATLAPDGKVKELHIVYDTVTSALPSKPRSGVPHGVAPRPRVPEY